MKSVLLGVVAIFAIALAENFPSTEPNGLVFQNQEPYSFRVSMSGNEDLQLVDDNLILEELVGRSFIADLIQNTLEDFRDVVINGNESTPPLDPLVIDKIGPFEYDITGVRAQVSIKKFRAEGLRWYVVDHVTFNAFRLALGTQITLPWLTVTGSYDAEARVAILLTHRARGNFRVFINRFVVAVDMRMGTSILGGHLLLRELDIRLDIADMIINIDGMTGSSLINTFINSFVQSLTQEIIQNQLDGISKMISEEIFDTVNDFLKDYTINDIMP